jgi:general secretion pathway protein F
MTIARFAYKAATGDGEIVSGIVDGATRDQVVEQLRAAGHTPIRVDPAPLSRPSSLRRLRRRRISEEQIGVATRELSTLLRAGMPLDRALGVLVSLTDGEPLGEVLTDIRRQPTRTCSAAFT